MLFLGGDAGRSVLEDGTSWKPYWARVWGARGLLYVWDDAAAPGRARAAGRRALAGRRDVPEGLRAARAALRRRRRAAAGHELPRVRATAARALGVCGDVEHLAAVHELLEDPDEDVRRAAARALERAETRLDT